MIARVPASSANLGPGFDTLALALSLYVEIEAEPSRTFEISAVGEGCEIRASDDHLGARVARRVLGHSNVHLRIRSQIPLSRGLGSSAAFVAACAAALGSDDPFSVACEFDGHPENAAASVYGGLVTATSVGGSFSANRLALDHDLAVVVVIPEMELATKEARGILPVQVSFSDATYNLGRMGMLVAGLADISLLNSEATKDKLHQAYRSALFPESVGILETLIDCGAIASCWSGAGPTMLGFCRCSDTSEVANRVSRALKDFETSLSVRPLQVDSVGLIVSNDYGPDFLPLEVASF